ncbi:hypothetical protein DTO013E5_7076 [Penicillium roqueforti]|uniref:Genomic scaffold, ProqFM164S01 n=1 Tax=Penicillium roqueforti (strain FM164) TaxID=1365484 RepID=W6PSJ1_PENRF|nr:uncharacterized protein LCP9604111_3142 [Penicillium roqueforti]CDM26716.1 unnamed protein product [Penicillium roqueforti FM164]KAF9250938.1 hypothetical protein LCP9604111_3142 [Penicillium roqueforti]KAI1833487.1 hypothetical protein CBS147337_5526 [Penicillium roqueforti]KAI2673097.1 hypothetical protein CBS147355_7900 [Penicillium roqueforti]KAI2674740.1 hypothetical protein LCP963914a_8662 [Penicillium roqueforti]
MRFLSTIFSAVLLLISVANASFSTDILYWPLESPQPSVLASISYDPTSLKSDVVSYHPPKDDQRDNLVRVGLYTSTSPNKKQWVGSLVSLSSLTASEQPTFRLHLGPTNEVYTVSLSASTSAQGSTSSPQIELVSNESGTQPHLNRPVIVGPDGQNPEQPEEKSILQKYWWVIPILMFLSMSAGGGGEGQ